MQRYDEQDKDTSHGQLLFSFVSFIHHINQTNSKKGNKTSVKAAADTCTCVSGMANNVVYDADAYIVIVVDAVVADGDEDGADDKVMSTYQHCVIPQHLYLLTVKM